MRSGRSRLLLLQRCRCHGLGGLVGDHLLLRWEEDGVEYAVALHAWEPLTEAAATLREVLVSAG